MWSEWPWSKNLQTVNAGEGVEKREPSLHFVGGNINLYSYYGEQYGGFIKKNSIKPWKMLSVNLSVMSNSLQLHKPQNDHVCVHTCSVTSFVSNSLRPYEL